MSTQGPQINRVRFAARAALIVAVIGAFATVSVSSLEATTTRFGNAGWIHWLIGFFALVSGLIAAGATFVTFIDRRGLRRHRIDPGAPMTDGQQVALSGRVRVEGTPLQSPFSDTGCAGFSYQVTGQRRGIGDRAGGNRSTLCLAGFALSAAVLDCGSRIFPIRAIPDVDTDFRSTAMGGAWGRRALERIRAGADTLPQVGGLEARGALESARRNLAGPRSMDFYVSPTIGTDNTISVIEDVLPADAEVTLLATYAAGSEGLDGRRRGGMKAFCGSLDTRLAALDHEFSKGVKIALVLLGIGLSLTSAAWWLP
ncbi:MAG: hypothetical protein CMP07_11155 [Xanthomonadales bacterium]|nr:hypothetical protein [Xanthomonadales bacterium]|tara:strand:+ start:2658 stop:3596 length:939 start_codon:yes stop_codon:yes gene_type:complete